MQYTAIFKSRKNDINMKKDTFLMFALNIDYGFMLEPPQWGDS